MYSNVWMFLPWYLVLIELSVKLLFSMAFHCKAESSLHKLLNQFKQIAFLFRGPLCEIHCTREFKSHAPESIPFQGSNSKGIRCSFPSSSKEMSLFWWILTPEWFFFSCRKITGKVSKFKEYLDKSKEICVELRRFLNFKGERKQWVNYDDESEEWEFPPAKLSYPYT